MAGPAKGCQQPPARGQGHPGVSSAQQSSWDWSVVHAFLALLWLCVYFHTARRKLSMYVKLPGQLSLSALPSEGGRGNRAWVASSRHRRIQKLHVQQINPSAPPCCWMTKAAQWGHAQHGAFVSPDSTKKLKDVLEEFNGDGVLSRYNPEQVWPCARQCPPCAAGSSQPPTSSPSPAPPAGSSQEKAGLAAWPPSLPMVLLPGLDAHQGHPGDHACCVAIPPHPAESFLGRCLARQNLGGIYCPPKRK